jgi:hypothetical protein
MAGQMQWRSTFGSSGAKSLHVRYTPHERWMSCHSVPGMAEPAGVMFPASSDFRTFQKLRSQGWQLLDQEEKVVVV